MLMAQRYYGPRRAQGRLELVALRACVIFRPGNAIGPAALYPETICLPGRDGAVMLARWPRGALSALAWAALSWARSWALSWAAAWAAYLLGQQLLAGDPLFAGAAAPQRLAALAVALLAVALVGCLAAGASFPRALAGLPLASRATALRDKSWHVAFLRQRDPDAAGRPRPRAPGLAPAAA
jgi:hypothetical protein